MRRVFIVYSATGNSLYTAERLKNDADEIITLPLKTRLDEDIDQIIFVFPVFYGAVPYEVTRFFEEEFIKRSNERLEYVAAVATCSLGHFYAPYALEKLLLESKVALSYMASVKGFPNGYPPLHKDGVISDKVIAKIDQIKRDLDNEEIKIMGRKPFSRRAWNFLRSFTRPDDTTLKASDKCTGCGKCVSLCPETNIEIKDGKAVFSSSCALCFACFNHCPENAILYKGKQYKQYVLGDR